MVITFAGALQQASAYTPISRSRHFEIESEAPVGRNPEVLPLITGAAVIFLCSRLYILSTKRV